MSQDEKITSFAAFQARLNTGAIRDARITKIRLDEAVMQNKEIHASIFENCDMKRVDMTQSRLSKVRFHGIRMHRINMKGIVANGLSIEHSEAMEADFADSRLFASSFRDTNTSNAVFSNSQVVDTKFVNCAMYNADFSHSTLVKTGFTDYNFQNIMLNNAHFAGCVLIDCNLSAANLQGADFSSALMLRVRLNDANLTDARFDGAVIIGCSFERCQGSEKQLHTLQAMNIIETDWRRPVLNFLVDKGIRLPGLVESLLAAYVTGKPGEAQTDPVPEITEPEPATGTESETIDTPADAKDTQDDGHPTPEKPRSKPIDDPALYERFKKLELD